MRRGFSGQLNDVFAQVSLNGRNAFGFQSSIQMNLLGRHALALDDQARAVFAGQFANDGVGFRSIARPMNLRAEFFSVRREFFQVSIKLKQRFVFDGPGLRTQLFPVAETARRLEPALAEQRRRMAQSAPQLHVIERCARVRVECFWG